MANDIYTPPKNHFYVYVLRDPRKGDKPFYVGKGKGRRAFAHLRQPGVGRNRHKNATIAHIRAAGLEPVITCAYNTPDERLALGVERLLIALYGRENLTNLTDGGEGVSNPSDDARTRIRNARLGHKASDETRQRISTSKAGCVSAMKGRHHTEEAKRKNSQSHIGLVAGMSGKQHTEESKKKMSASRGEDWRILFPDGHEEIIRSLFAFCVDHGLNRRQIGKPRGSEGYHAVRVD